MTTLHLRNSISRSPLRRGFFLIALALCCFTLLPTAHSQTCFSNCNDSQSNTALGTDALFLNSTGDNNTAIGAAALLHNTTGYDNTAIGSEALLSNTTGDYNTANGFTALRYNRTGY